MLSRVLIGLFYGLVKAVFWTIANLVILVVMGKQWYGRQITAARALAGLTIVELANEAGVTERTIRRIEYEPKTDEPKSTRGKVVALYGLAHNAITRKVWDKVIEALARHGVELSRGIRENRRGR